MIGKPTTCKEFEESEQLAEDAHEPEEGAPGGPISKGATVATRMEKANSMSQHWEPSNKTHRMAPQRSSWEKSPKSSGRGGD